MEELVEWSKSQGISIHESITLLERGEYGTQGTCLDDIPSEAILASIPYSSCLTPRTSAEFFNVPFQVLAEYDLEGPILALYLSSCTKTYASSNVVGRNRWRVYVDSLPKTLETLDYWTDEELGWFQGTGLDKSVDSRRESWTNQYAALRTVVPQDKWINVSFEEWKWSMTILSTRSFPSSLIHSTTDTTVSGAGLDSHPILLPVLDTFNHTSPLSITWHSTPTHIHFITNQSIPSNSQVFNNYGNKSTGEFLLTYGFYAGLDVLFLAPSTTAIHETALITFQNLIPHDLIDAILPNHAGTKEYILACTTILHGLLLKRQHLDRVIQGHGERFNLVMKYKTSQSTLCLASITALQDLIHRRLIECEDRVVTLDTALRENLFRDATRDCFGVATVQDALDSDLTDVILALYLSRSLDTGNSESAGDVKQEQQKAEAEDVWQQIQSCTEIAPQIFGQLDKMSFEHAIFRVWNESVEVDDTLYVFL